MNIRRIHAIFEKDIKDLMKNATLIITMMIPIIISLVLERVRSGAELPIAMLYMIVGGTFAAVTAGSILTMMAEENEKKTLRGLLQSPASIIDVMIGKSLVTSIMSFISITVSILIIGIEPFRNGKAVLGLVLLFLFFLLLGISIALFSKSVAATSALLMPFTLLFGFTPMIGSLGLASEDGIVANILALFPVMQAVQIHETGSWLPIGIIFIWIIGAALLTYASFRKVMTDD